MGRRAHSAHSENLEVTQVNPPHTWCALGTVFSKSYSTVGDSQGVGRYAPLGFQALPSRATSYIPCRPSPGPTVTHMVCKRIDGHSVPRRSGLPSRFERYERTPQMNKPTQSMRIFDEAADAFYVHTESDGPVHRERTRRNTNKMMNQRH